MRGLSSQKSWEENACRDVRKTQHDLFFHLLGNKCDKNQKKRLVILVSYYNSVSVETKNVKLVAKEVQESFTNVTID